MWGQQTIFRVAQQHNKGLGCLSVQVSRLHTHTQTVGLLWTSDQPVAVAATCTTHSKTQQTNIYVLSGIRTRSRSNPASADPRRRPRGHWQRYASSHVLQTVATLVTDGRSCFLEHFFLEWSAEGDVWA